MSKSNMEKPPKNADEFLEEVVSASSKLDIHMPNLPKPLTIDEKKYLLVVERGDLSAVKKLLQKARRKKTELDINCVDPLGRGALLMAIDNEDLSMVELLVVMKVETKDALLHAINTEFVEAVELLLEHEELIHKEGEPYSWERIDRSTATFTPEITPLILAAHKNNYEILKLLLDRGATIPMPHDVRCGCEICVKASNEDSLRYSMSRINAYRALASPSLIALSSSDPLLTAFELSWELRNLAYTEQEFKEEYLALKQQCMDFAVSLLGHARSSQELAVIMNHDPTTTPYEDGDHMSLARLELAINYKQKKFVAHPNVQQLLASLWYEGLPGFRRKNITQRLVDIVKVALLFPIYCMLYMICPKSSTGQLMKKPFMKFLIHSSSYLFFLFLLILMSQRVETVIIQLFGSMEWREWLVEELRRQRGNKPTIIELAVVWYVIGFIVEEVKELWHEGVFNYLRNMWNVIDITRNTLYLVVIGLRVLAYFQQQQEIAINPAAAFIPREDWDAFDPQLIAEGLCAAANVFSALKLVHMFSINPHLGPLQISLGRMVIDIIKFLIIYSLVLFAFACGLNQLLWYYADLEKQKCYSLPGGLPDWNKNADACMNWRRFANLFESSQSLFWATFGMVGLEAFELTGIKTYTRFWGMLMFGSYSVINVVVLLNLLIAMMSNSFALITERSDTEWKFARTKLWLNYFEDGTTLPPPFNIIPTPKNIARIFGKKSDVHKKLSFRRKEKKLRERDYRYTAVMRSLVWRYVSTQQRKAEEREVTEDDINEVKNDISAFRCVLLDILKDNGMEVADDLRKNKAAAGRKARIWERRLLKDFYVAPVKNDDDDFGSGGDNENPTDRFRRVARLALARRGSLKSVGSGQEVSHIGFSKSRDSFRNRESLKKVLEEAERQVSSEISPDPSPRSTSPYLPEAGSSLVSFFQNANFLSDEDAMNHLNVNHPSQPSLSPMSTMKNILKKLDIKEEDESQECGEKGPELNLMKFSPRAPNTPDIQITGVNENSQVVRSETQSRCNSERGNSVSNSNRATPLPRGSPSPGQILNAKDLLNKSGSPDPRAMIKTPELQVTQDCSGRNSVLGDDKRSTPGPITSRRSTPAPGIPHDSNDSKKPSPVPGSTPTPTESRKPSPAPGSTPTPNESRKPSPASGSTPVPNDSRKPTPVPESTPTEISSTKPTDGVTDSKQSSPTPCPGDFKSSSTSPTDSTGSTPVPEFMTTLKELRKTGENVPQTYSSLIKKSEDKISLGNTNCKSPEVSDLTENRQMHEGKTGSPDKFPSQVESPQPIMKDEKINKNLEGDKPPLKPVIVKQDSIIGIETPEPDPRGAHVSSPFNTDTMLEKLEKREEPRAHSSPTKVIKKRRAPVISSRSNSRDMLGEDLELGATANPFGTSSFNPASNQPSILPPALMRNNLTLEGWVDAEDDDKISPTMTPLPPTPQPTSGGDMSPLLAPSPNENGKGKVEDVNTIKRVPKTGWL